MDSENELNDNLNDAAEETHESFNPNSFIGTLSVAVVLCLVCSLVVSVAAVALRPIQQRNQENKMKRNVLIAAGLWDPETSTDQDIPEMFKSIETVAVNLPGRAEDAPIPGTLNEEVDLNTYNQVKAAKDPHQSIFIADEDVDDIAGIKRRETVGLAYLVNDSSGKLETVVVPIYGKGLWSTLYGYIALEADCRTVRGITFYQHGETPGLGGEVDNPKWKAQWVGKEIISADGVPDLKVTKPGNATADNQVDGLSGATITSSGVERTVRYWLGEDAYGPFLDRIREQ
ncbi:Na(+)-translocating NADH-quinone reductase subunit C [Thalassoglobus neptunius]|uniref:Na(+)-translocating NADH-quinone reductase subunit C n=1 Tax=Thalassoglobus neptunius TaxID=1938619 RepID=A0A5C5X6X8_9PLAN|nr:Na(+)-translocating NADH-quinone reductase subunit C [Thalassoglobus neptunius]TWT58680.1 Na(+)-translocating NADH-quinone reductase subunit C [Thalassoglobus neptunius]